MMIGQKRKRLVRKTAAAEFTNTGQQGSHKDTVEGEGFEGSGEGLVKKEQAAAGAFMDWGDKVDGEDVLEQGPSKRKRTIGEEEEEAKE